MPGRTISWRCTLRAPRALPHPGRQLAPLALMLERSKCCHASYIPPINVSHCSRVVGREACDANAPEASGGRHDSGALIAPGQDSRVRAPSPDRTAPLRDAPEGAGACRKRAKASRYVVYVLKDQPHILAFYVENPPGISVSRHGRIPALASALRYRQDDRDDPEAAHLAKASSARTRSAR